MNRAALYIELAENEHGRFSKSWIPKDNDRLTEIILTQIQKDRSKDMELSIHHSYTDV